MSSVVGDGQPAVQRGHQRVLALIVAVVVVLAAAGVGFIVWQQHRPHTQDLGAGVTLRGTGLPDGLSAVTAQVPDPVSSPQVAIPGAAFDLQPSGPLGASARLTLPVGDLPEANVSPVIMTSESVDGPWTPLRSIYDEKAQTVSATVTHFSFHLIEWVKKNALTAALTDVFHGLTSNVGESASPPDCSRSRGDTGFVLSGETGSALATCLGLIDNQRTLLVTNMRKYTLIVDPGATARLASGPSSVAAWVSNLTLPGQQFSLAPGDTATVTLSGPTLVRSSFDGLAQSVYALQVGVQTMVEVLGKFGFTAARPVQDIAEDLASTPACADALLQDAEAGSVISGCFGDIENLTGALGVGGLVGGVVMSLTSTAAFFDGQLRALVDQFTGADAYSVGVLVAPVGARPGSGSSTPAPSTQPTPRPTPTATGSTAASVDTSIGGNFHARCTEAWPTAPQYTSDGIVMTMQCAGVSTNKYTFVQVSYADTDFELQVNQYVMVDGSAVDVAQSAAGFTTLVVEADHVEID
jgi:hypothetical protein